VRYFFCPSVSPAFLSCLADETCRHRSWLARSVVKPPRPSFLVLEKGSFAGRAAAWLLLWGAKFCLSAQAWSTPKFSPQNDAKCSLPTSHVCRRGSITNKKPPARQTYYAKYDLS
jgi:hypothetical protein